MQSSIFQPADLPQLDAPNPISHTLFEDPILGIIVLALFGLLVAATLRSMGKTGRALITIGITTIVAAAVYITSALVTTQREHVADASRDLVQAVADGSSSDLSRLLDQDIEVSTRFAGAQGRERVISLATTRAAPAVQSHQVREVTTQILGPRIARSHIRVRVEGQYAPIQSVWSIDWQRETTESDWQATFIEPLWIQGFDRPNG